VQEVLDKTNSGIQIDSFKGFWNPTGCNADNFYQFEINGTHMLRVARTDKANIPREKEVIDQLHKKVSLSFPDYIHISEDGTVGIYENLDGDSLTKEKYASLSDSQKEKLARDLASLFYGLHNLYTLEEVEKNLGILDESTQVLKGVHKRVPDPSETEQELEKLIVENAKKSPEDQIKIPDHQFNELRKVVFAGYKKIYKDPKYKSLVHNDVYNQNIIIDPETNRLRGILEFENMAIGDICRDPRFFYAIDRDLPNKVYENYALKTEDMDAQELQLRSDYHLGFKEISNLVKILKTPEVAIDEDLEVPSRLDQFMKTEAYQKTLTDYQKSAD